MSLWKSAKIFLRKICSILSLRKFHYQIIKQFGIDMKQRGINMENINQLAGEVVNPATGKTLATENRITNIEVKGDQLHIKYNREGISPDHKKQIEDNLIKKLSSLFGEDNIYILTESKQSAEVYQSIGARPVTETKNPAQIKVGHGQVGEKKPIPGVKYIVAIGSGKGGVGKSTFTSNLAVTLAASGKKVGVIDADIYGPSLPMLFNKRNVRPEATQDKKIIPLESCGIKFISFGNFIQEEEPVVWRGPMLGGVLSQFFFETDWGELDYLLLDLPPGTGDVQLSMVQNVNVDGSIIISTPQDVALLDAKKALAMFDKVGVHVIGMVENMSSFICDSCNKEHFIYGTNGVMATCNEMGVGYLGKIPLELGLRKGADFGTPYMSQNKYEGSKVWTAYKEIASKLDSYFYPGDNKKSFFSKIFTKKA
jgi:ATP-binding protein involved in chromosome partitioning